jgi:predicted RNA-binding Zn ribbon-like protein
MAGEPTGTGGGLRPAPGEDVSSALALVNTRLVHADRPVDLIADAGQAGAWLAARGLIPAGRAVTGTEATALRTLRESIRGLLAARAASGEPAAGDVGLLNATLAAAPPIPALAWDESGPHRAEGGYATPSGTGEVPRGPQSLGAGRLTSPGLAIVAFARLADDALALLTASGGGEAAPCGAHGCIRWFLRTHAARQWCSTRCGDRVRAARHYARHHLES